MTSIIREKFSNMGTEGGNSENFLGNPLGSRIQVKWAYGFSAGISKGGLESDKRPIVMNFVNDLKDKMKDTKRFINLDRLSQKDIDQLYLDADLYVYGTFFPEIDCISFTKAVSANCRTVVMGPGALIEKNKLLNKSYEIDTSPSDKSLDKSLSGPLFDVWVSEIIRAIEQRFFT